jgi:vitamin B12 transporter
LRFQQALVVSVLLVGGTTLAATDDEQSDAPRESGVTERVEVTAALPRGDDVAAFATRLDTDQVSERGEDLADVLRRVPGARVRDYGGLGSFATVSLRASTAEQVTVLVDGVPQNRALGGAVDLSSIPATQVESVTVFRGFAPASYGLGGLGGLVDIRTREAAGEAGAQVDLLVGGLQTKRVSGGLALENGAGALRIGAEALRSEGDFLYYDGGATPFNATDGGIERRTNNDVEQRSVLAQQRFDDVGSGQMRVGLRVQRRDRGVPGLGDSKSSTARLDDGLDDLTASWSRRELGALDGIDLLADGFRQTSRFSDPQGDLAGGSQDRKTELTGGGLSALVRGSPGRHRLMGRAELRLEDADVHDAISDRSGGSSRRVLAVTAEEIVTFGRLSVAPSLRWESLENEYHATGGTFTAPPDDLSNDALTGKIGVALTIDPGLVMRGSAGTFHRNPSMMELYGDTGAIQGNVNLRPESGDSVELGLDWRRRRERFGWNLEVVGFGRRVRDLIWLNQNSAATSTLVNYAQAEIYGAELAAGLSGPWGLSFEASGTLQRAYDTTPLFPDDRPLPFHPNLLGYFGVAYERRGFATRWETTYVGENSTTRLDWSAFRIPQRIVHDLVVSYRWRNGVRASVDVRNVFDRQVLDLMRYPLPSRVIFLHLGWRPGGPV